VNGSSWPILSAGPGVAVVTAEPLAPGVVAGPQAAIAAAAEDAARNCRLVSRYELRSAPFRSFT
jgi:hypothetical protein